MRGTGTGALTAAIDWAAGQLSPKHIGVRYTTEDSDPEKISDITGPNRFWVSVFPSEGKDRTLPRSVCARPVQLPLLFAPLGIAYNGLGMGDLTLDRSLVAEIFGGAVTRWQDPKIVARNRGIQLQDGYIYSVRGNAYSAGDNPTWETLTMRRFMWANGYAGWKHWMLMSLSDSGFENMSARYKVSQADSTIAYVVTGHSSKAPVQFAAVDFGAGPVRPTPQATMLAAESARFSGVSAAGDIRIDEKKLFTSRVPGAYPLMAPISVALCGDDLLPPEQSEALREVLHTIVVIPPETAAELGYAPLSPEFQGIVRAAIDSLG